MPTPLTVIRSRPFGNGTLRVARFDNTEPGGWIMRDLLDDSVPCLLGSIMSRVNGTIVSAGGPSDNNNWQEVGTAACFIDF